MRHIVDTLKTVYEIKTNYKINKQSVSLLFVNQRLAVEFGEYAEGSKRTRELEKAGFKIFNTPHGEDAYAAIGRLIHVLHKLDQN